MKRKTAMYKTLSSFLLTAALIGCDPNDAIVDIGDTETHSTDTDYNPADPDCGPMEDALVAEEFNGVLWGGENIYVLVRTYKYFVECEVKCPHDYHTLLWRVDPEGNKTEVFSIPDAEYRFVDITPDGARLVLADSETETLSVINSTGETVAEFDGAIYNDAALSPDGSHILLKSTGATATDAVWTMANLSDNTRTDMVLPTNAKARFVSWSPDGLQLAYIDDTAAGTPLTLCNADDTAPRVLGGNDPNDMRKVVWRSDGQAIFYEDKDPQSVDTAVGSDWYELSLADGSIPKFITAGLGTVISPTGARTLYLENSWLSVMDIALERSIFTLSGRGGYCCK